MRRLPSQSTTLGTDYVGPITWTDSLQRARPYFTSADGFANRAPIAGPLVT